MSVKASRKQAPSNVVTLFPQSKPDRFVNPYASDPHFLAWVHRQNDLAVDAEFPYENYADLARRYIRLMDLREAMIREAKVEATFPKPGRTRSC